MALHRHVGDARTGEQLNLNPLHHALGAVPRFRIPAAAMAPGTAARLVRDELMLDGNARLNLATFVTTWMEPEALALMADTVERT